MAFAAAVQYDPDGTGPDSFVATAVGMSYLTFKGLGYENGSEKMEQLLASQGWFGRAVARAFHAGLCGAWGFWYCLGSPNSFPEWMSLLGGLISSGGSVAAVIATGSSWAWAVLGGLTLIFTVACWGVSITYAEYGLWYGEYFTPWQK